MASGPQASANRAVPKAKLGESRSLEFGAAGVGEPTQTPLSGVSQRSSTEIDMLDHIGLDVSDITASRAFHERALKPLGYRIIREIREGGTTVVMFGVGDEPDFVISDKDRPAKRRTSPSGPKAGPRWTPSTLLRWRPEDAITARRG